MSENIVSIDFARIIKEANQKLNKQELWTLTCPSNTVQFIDKYLKEVHSNKTNGYVYQFFEDGVLKYTGKSSGGLFRNRLRAHFLGMGTGTSSKYDFIKEALANDKTIGIRSIQTNPASLRNLIEEELITEMKETGIKNWNGKRKIS